MSILVRSHKAIPKIPPMDARERNVYRVFLSAARAVAGATSMTAVARALDVYDTDQALAAMGWGKGTAALESMLPKQYRVAYEIGGQEAAKALSRRIRKRDTEVGLNYAFNTVNPNAVDFARDRSGALIREWVRTSQDAIRAMVTRAFEEGIAPRDLARMIVRSGIGLTERMALAVIRRRRDLAAAGLTGDRLDARVGRYADQLLRQRGENIARTEIMMAHRVGSQASWEQAAAEGLINRDTAMQEWMANPGACPEICVPLHGKTAKMGEPFEGGYMGPPAHVACRCALALNP